MTTASQVRYLGVGYVCNSTVNVREGLAVSSIMPVTLEIQYVTQYVASLGIGGPCPGPLVRSRRIEGKECVHQRANAECTSTVLQVYK